MTDLIFRMEALDESFIQSTMPEIQARHDSSPTTSELLKQQTADLAAADRAGAEEVRAEPIRNVEKRVGRNEPCPCGSGKKFKACHGRN